MTDFLRRWARHSRRDALKKCRSPDAASEQHQTLRDRRKALHGMPRAGSASHPPSVLRQLLLFSTLPDSEIGLLADALEARQFESGEVLLKEDEPGDRYFVVLEGEVQVIKAHGTSDERVLGFRSEGSFLGEMSLFVPDGRHTASVIARTPVKVLQMDHAELDALLRRYPDFAYEIIRTLSQRLDESENKTIRELRRKNRALEKALRDLQAAQAELVEKERLERELEVAREIQLSILPASLPDTESAQIGARLESMAAVGGDFYDVIPLDESRTAFVVGDVSDHGVPAALLMAQTATLIRVLGQQKVTPTEVLREVNSYLIRSNEAGMFVTVLFAIYDSSNGRLTFARAGHELPIIFDPENSEVKLDEAVGQPLGLFSHVAIDQQTLEVEPGSLILLYTDGVTEATNRNGSLFGPARLRRVAARSTNGAPQALCDGIFGSLADFRGDEAPLDDVTVMAVRLGGPRGG